MSRNPSFAIVLEGGLVQAILVQDWPTHMSLPPFAVVDYDIEDAEDDDITRISIGDAENEAVCHGELPVVHELFKGSLSPRAVLEALNKPVVDSVPEPLAVTRQVRQSIIEFDARLNADEHVPTGNHYNELYVLAQCGLIDVLKALGDPTDFGD